MKKSEIIESIIEAVIMDERLYVKNKRECLEWLYEQYKIRKWLDEPTEDTAEQEVNSNA